MTPRDLALALLVNFVWAFNYVAAKEAVAHLPPVLVTTLRFVLVAAVLWPWLRWPRGQMRRLAWVVLFTGIIHFGLIFTGLKLAENISVVAVLSQLSVPMTTVLAVLVLKETLGWRRAAGAGLAFGGVVIITFDPRVFAYVDAVILIVLAALSMAIGLILMRSLRGVGPFTMQAWTGVASAIGLALVSLALEQGQVEAMAAAPWMAWGGVVFAALGTSIIGHGGFYYLVGRYPLSTVMPLTLLTPVLAIGLGAIIYGDPIDLRFAVGCAFTLAGVLAVLLYQERRT